MGATFDINTLRILLHVLAVTVWLGGQIVMLALLPVLRSADVEGLPAAAARAFNRVAWPAFALAFFTGIWNFLSVDPGDATAGWNAAFGIKFLLVLVSGGAAFAHSVTDKPAIRGITGALGFAAALGAFILGYVISIH